MFTSPKLTGLNSYADGEKLDLQGICRSNIYYSEETMFGVYYFEDNENNIFKIQGTFLNKPMDGQSYKISGKITNYKGEKVFKTFNIAPIKPFNKKGIISYLKTLYGLKSKAELIYDIFGDNSIDILLKEPLKVANSIKGIGKKSVVKWQEQLKSLEENQDIYVRLLGYGISDKNVQKLLKEYGQSIVDEIEDNPYLIMEKVKGYGFLKNDKIALEMGVNVDNLYRIRASIIYILEQSSTKGHCFLPIEELINNTIDLLDFKLTITEMKEIYEHNFKEETVEIEKNNHKYTINIKKLKECIDKYHKSKGNILKNNSRYIYEEVNAEKIGDEIHYLISNRKLVYENSNVYLKRLYYAEHNFAKHIKSLAKYDNVYDVEKVENILNNICRDKGYELEAKQREACIEFNLSEGGVYILNGSAGTGKTFTFNLILEVARELNNLNKLPILAVAPTGKASKVATKSIGMECKTIHRALGFSPVDGFVKNEYNPFKERLIACDEGSMIDIELGYAFVNAIEVGSKLFILGDTKQLPSVGAGNVLKDMINSGLIKVITLDVIKRQGNLSGIVENANRILDNKNMETSDKKDFFVLERKTIGGIQECVKQSIRRILTFKDYTLEDIQVLIPQRTGSLGVNMLNYILQQEFNPYSGGEKIFKSKFESKLNENDNVKEYYLYIQKGDKVIHIKNNYTMVLYKKDLTGSFKEAKLGVTNGECGVVEDIYKIGKGLRVVVRYEDLYAYYDEGVEELELAFATTIHKSQGSAWKAVILPIAPQHTHMLSNNLLYTGVTRARDFCVVTGDSTTILRGIMTHTVALRHTNLANKIVS